MILYMQRICNFFSLSPRFIAKSHQLIYSFNWQLKGSIYFFHAINLTVLRDLSAPKNGTAFLKKIMTANRKIKHTIVSETDINLIAITIKVSA